MDGPPLDEPGKLFLWCSTVAFAYPMMCLLIGWMLGAPAKLGNTEILPPASALEPAAYLLLIFGLTAIGSNIFLLKNLGHIANRVGSWFISLTIYVLIYALAGLSLWLAGAETFALVVAGAFVAVVATFAGLAVVFAFGALSALGKVGFLFSSYFLTTSLAIVIAAILLAAMPVNGPQISVWLLFWIFLPTINAIFDWASWWISRSLGRNLVSVLDHPGTPFRKRACTFIQDILIDLIVAMFLLVALTWIIPRIIDAWNSFVVWMTGGEAPLELATYLCAAAKSPLTDRLWATGMLFSTLVPTAAHLTLLLLAFILWPFQPRTLDHQRAAHILEDYRPPAIDLTGIGEETRVKTWPEQAPSSYAIPDDINNNRRDAYGGPLHSDTVNALSWKLGVRRPAYYVAAFIGLCALLYYGIGAAFASWHPLPQILLMIAGFTKGEVDACFAS